MSDIRKAREFCFQYFFHLQLPIFRELKDELSKDPDNNILTEEIATFKESTSLMFKQELNEFIQKHIKTTLMNYDQIEDITKENLKNWKLHRLNKVDNTVLLLAINELCFLKETPVTVVINEAIEISKKFGNAQSSKFINGILDNIAKKHVQ